MMTLIVFNIILSAITVRLIIFLFSISIILINFSYNTLVVIITSTIFSAYSFNDLI